MSCYWFAEACRDGHVAACPAREGDPWAGEETQPSEERRPIVLAASGDPSGWYQLGNGTWVLDE